MAYPKKILAAILMMSMAAPAALSQQFEDHKLLAPDGDDLDQFGHAVSLSGPVVVSGACCDEDNGLYSGSAAVFRLDAASGNWLAEGKLLASDGSAYDQFAWSVSVSGGTILITSPFSDDNGIDSGSAYIYTFDPVTGSWQNETKLLPADGDANDYFGYSASLAGDVAVIGAIHDEDNGLASGSAYVFRRDPATGAWSEESKLLPADGSAYSQFGWSVSVSGDIVIVGSPYDDSLGNNSGSAYAFRFDANGGSWTEEAKLLPADGAVSDQFGWTVSVSGDAIAVGSPFDNDGLVDAGAVYVFRDSGGTWTEEAKLKRGDGENYDCFGWSLAVAGDALLIGTPFKDSGFKDSGSAYLYRYDASAGAWSEEAVLLPSDGAEADLFSWSVALSPEAALAGSQFDDDGGIDSGSAYLYCFGQSQGPSATDLLTARGVDIGDVSVWNDGEHLFVKCTAAPPFFLQGTKVHAASGMDGIPQTKNGNPVPGHFDWKESHSKGTAEYTYAIDMQPGWVRGTELFIAVKASLSSGDGEGSSAWASGNEFPGKNWATWFQYTLQ